MKKLKIGDLVENEYYVLIVTEAGSHYTFAGCVLKIKKDYTSKDPRYTPPFKGEIRYWSRSVFKKLKRGTIIKP